MLKLVYGIVNLILCLFKIVGLLFFKTIELLGKFLIFINKDKNCLNKKIGVETANCPYCHISLKKFPGRKTKCKNCGNYIYVRTRPADNKKILIKEDEKELINIEWEKKNGIYELRQQERNKFFEIKKKLCMMRHTDYISDNDVYWVMYNEDRVLAAAKKDWAQYAHITCNMAELLYNENKYLEALRFYLEDAYFQTCNPTDNGFIEREITMAYPRCCSLLRNTIICIKELNLSIDDVQKEFFNLNIVNARFPLTKKESWKFIKQGIKEWE